MKYTKYLSLIFTILTLGLTFSTANAQVNALAEDVGNQQFNEPQRPNLMRALGLSREQIQQIRRINNERQPVVREARMRLEKANRALDEAIYSDSFSETEIEQRVQEAGSAHTEFIKSRALNEIEINKVLNPGQLERFRAMRQDFKQQNRASKMQNRQNGNQIQSPPNRLKNLPRKLRNRPQRPVN